MHKVCNLQEPNAIKTAIVITHNSEPSNEILFVHKSVRGKREQNDDGTWPSPVKSSDDVETGEQQLQSGVGIKRYVLQDGEYSVEEVIESPKRRCLHAEERGVSEPTVSETKDEQEFMFWDDFVKNYGNYDIISEPKNLDMQHLA